MTKFDYKKDLKQLYFPPAKIFTFVEVPPMNFLMIDGHGDPNKVPVYQEALEALYTVAYTIKFALKPRDIEYVIPPAEGLWWMEDMRQSSQETKDRWDWTMMIMQPQDVSAEVVEQARGSATRKKELPALNKLRFERFHEGLCVQIMYFGAYADEGPTIASMHAFIHEQGYELTGKHHEIYLGDHRRTPPEKLKTVIRQPVKIKA